MSKPYFNDAIIGNSRMLCCVTKKGELIRLFWPNIDYPQHIERMLTGIFFNRYKNSTLWFNEDNWCHNQLYIEDTNILKTLCEDREKGLKIEQLDFVLYDRDILIRSYTIENTGENEVDLGFVQYSSAISTTSELRSTLFDFNVDALIHYRHGYYISVLSDFEVLQFQLGNNAFDCARHTELNGYDSIGMMNDGALSWKIGTVLPRERKKINLFICASHTLKGVKELAKACKLINVEEQLSNTKDYWHNYLKKARQVETSNNQVNTLYKRSLLVFKLMSDEKTGGLLASAEIDEEFTKCGRYAYCWGRDAAFITEALDVSGLSHTVDKFYKWAAKTQEEDGSWHQRYYMDGNLAPSWGMQIDETGTLIWGMLKHYKLTKDSFFIEQMWNSIKLGVEFLVNFIDEETGLPKPSHDLWEERVGEHTYSAAAVYAGIKAGVEAGRIVNASSEIINKWDMVASLVKRAIEKNLWSDKANRFIRSIRTKLNSWGSENSENTTIITVNNKGYKRDVTLEDWTIDTSILGVSVPFEVFDPKDERVKSTVEAIEKALTCHPVGGIKRYENDNYVGGNPWILTTLWVALYYIKVGEYKRAKNYFDWAVNCTTELGFLPEQISRDKGKPCWVIPLTWSHAMFVLVFVKLNEAGII
ncbi:UNVERIFIED_CONTAM: oligosaccharide amylase [Acetivibrio alkalicellulosi]